MRKDEILDIVEKVHNLKKNKSNTLPDNSYFLDKDMVVCFQRENGDSRYPYRCGGMTMFAHTNGYIDCVEGRFNIFQCQYTIGDTPVYFYAGEKMKDGYFPISITGAARQLFEPQDIARYLVYTPVCAYYVVETEQAIYSVRLYVDNKKHLHFAIAAINKGEEREIYLGAYFDAFLREGDCDYAQYANGSKYGFYLDDGRYILAAKDPNKLNSSLNYLAIKEHVTGDSTKKYSTTSKMSFVGRNGGNITNAEAKKNGKFSYEARTTSCNDAPVAADIIHFRLKENDFAMIEYEMLQTNFKDEADDFLKKEINTERNDLLLDQKRILEELVFDAAKIEFYDWKNQNLHHDVINKFLRFVQRQASFCALGDNYAGDKLGIRDVFQQLETALIWQPNEARCQIVRIMDYILDTGRAPRQIIFKENGDGSVNLNLAPYIDQGLWIISTFYTYLAYTDDKSILNEICGYYHANNTLGPAMKSDEKDSILCHLVRIADFLISNIDEDTKCLKILKGDWNDAIDNLGKSKDKAKEYGNGVSVMATEQLYLALGDMCEILRYAGRYTERIKEYSNVRKRIAQGFGKFAIVRHKDEVKIIHGWGENREYYVGSFKDYDHQSRLSLTSNAYYAISGLSEVYPEINDGIVKSIMKLDSKYGLITFDKAFYPYSDKIGRLSQETIGTYENAAAYVHAGTFGIMALFIMGRAEYAWQVFEKTMTISHENATKTTFIMPNSYCVNDEYGVDGDSMSDWHTGSGTALLKGLIKYGLGIQPTLDGLIIAPPKFMPSNNVKVELCVKKQKIKFIYENCNNCERQIFVDGKKVDTAYNKISDTNYVFIDNETLKITDSVVVVD